MPVAADRFKCQAAPVRTHATTVEGYLAQLPLERRAPITLLRELILEHLGEGFEEHLTRTQIAYTVSPKLHRLGRPLIYVGLASQKRHMAIYLRALAASPSHLHDFEVAWRATGLRLNLGKCTLRFRSLDALDLDLIAESVSAYSAAEFATLRTTRTR